MSSPKRYAIVGTGGRSRMFIDAIAGRYAEQAALVGFCDLSPTRMAHWNRHLAEEHGHATVPAYEADRFDAMIRETRPDVVIVTTMDSTHHTYIIRAMELGADVVCEKPMTTDEVKAARVFDAIDRTGRSLRVTFNYRYQSAFAELKQIVSRGEIGRPTLVDFQWRLDTSHGADYFRRWHREKDKSGGLLVHKSTHHFDLVNWILDDRPEQVFAHGGLMFYGRDNARQRGEDYGYDRYTGHVTREQDPFALPLSGESRGVFELESLYLEAEADSGYVRDRNVFGGEDRWPITSEDTMAVTARYRRGTLLSYSLIAYAPWEGERLTVTGTRGQVEYFGRGQGHIIAGQSDAALAEQQYQGEQYIRLQRMFEPPVEVEIPPATGGHGGGDARILERVFSPDPEPDPLQRDATHLDGAVSILTGVAANRSIETGLPVRLDDLLVVPERGAKQMDSTNDG